MDKIELKQLKYRKVISVIIKFIDSPDVIVLHGARQVGKTSIMQYLINNELNQKSDVKNIVYFDLEDFNLLNLCNSGVERVIDYLKELDCNFKKKIYLFLDEIHYLDNPSSFLKLFHDRYKGQIKLIVSGSSSFAIKSKFKDSLAGRTVNFEIFGLDFEEFLWFRNKNYKLGPNLTEILNKELKKLYTEYVLYGSYPRIVLERAIVEKEHYLKQIINTYIKKDINDIANIQDIKKFNDLIRILAGQSGNLLNVLELSNTLKIARQTVEEYLFILENTYIIRRIYPWHRNIRSELTKMPKIYLEDTGIVNLLINKSFSKVLSGQLLENAVYSNLRKNLDAEDIYFWRTNVGQEVDFIIEKGKKIIPTEVKLKFLNKYLTNLNYFKNEYNIKKSYFVTLDKREASKHKNVFVSYPWELIGINGR
ncbi:MAG: ATP-binding protein [Candidatus Kuenenbacteria bacterium]